MKNVPPPARLLGLAGLLPTLAAVALAVTGRPDFTALAQQVGAIYGAVILSFVGGAWWGLAARSGDAALGGWLVVSVLPSLLAALVIYLLTPAAIAALGLAFLCALAIDHRLVADGVAPTWWFALRLPLSGGMGVLHLVLAALL